MMMMRIGAIENIAKYAVVPAMATGRLAIKLLNVFVKSLNCDLNKGVMH